MRQNKIEIDAEWFKEQLTRRDLTQRKLAKLLGVNETHISKAFYGWRAFSPQEMADIAKIYDVPIEDVMRHAGTHVQKVDSQTASVIAVANGDGSMSAEDIPAPRRVDRPPGVSLDAVAARLLCPGTAFDGWLAYWVPTSRIEIDAVGRLSVVRVKGRGQFLRVLHRGTESGTWTLRTMCGQGRVIENARVDWAAPIAWLRC